jgi:DNA polymerase-3 subunit alpha
MVPMGSQGFPMTLERALEEAAELKELYKKDEVVKNIIDMAKKIEGCARHISVHAAGVVIAPIPLTEVTPLQFDPKGEGKIITQYDMYSIDEENAGLLKFDFLGLKNLSIIADTLRLAEKLKGAKIDIDTIPIDDAKTFAMLARGETEDLFQLNGDGMTRFLVDLKPTTIHDINAMVALYRPGPMQFIPVYIECKHDSSKVKYLDPVLEPILRKTYGVLVYQDDLLMMANKIAGYTWGEVDKFRKAVGKKIPKEMAEQKEKFIKGCVEYSKWPEKKARELWTWIEPFASYAFNKAHSVSYGRVAYITAYLKANFPAEYMSSVLTHESGDVDKVAISVAECKRIGIQVLPPDINESFEGFTIVKDENGKENIRFGLTSVKNFGEGIAAAIIEERKARGKFSSLEDFLKRVQDRNLNKKSLEALVKCGALDLFEDRGKLFHNIDILLEFNRENEKNSAQDSLFGSIVGGDKITLRDSEPLPQNEQLRWEKELLGLYISGHPLDKFREKMQSKGISIAKVLENPKEGQAQMILGVCAEMKEIRTKKGDLMAFVKMADFSTTMEVVLFPEIYENTKKIFDGENCIAIEGKISLRNGGVSLLAEKIRKI